jgi:hypothetical protein
MSQRMIAIPVQFDGKKIEVPAELKGREPRRVFILLEEHPRAGHSWRDVIGRVKKPVSEEQIDQWIDELRHDRDEQQ